MSTLPLALRRRLVFGGVLLSLAFGAVTIRAAAEWTAASAPLSAAPVSAETLGARLADERARSAALETALRDLTAQTAQLRAALDAAEGRVEGDAGTAADLRERLAAANEKLVTLQASIRSAQVGLTGTGTGSPAAARSGGDREKHEEDEKHDDDD